MKVAITVRGGIIDSDFDTRFGRAQAFCIVEEANGEWEILENPALSAAGGAGVQAAQFLSQKGVEAVVSGSFGPNAFGALTAAGIAMYTAPSAGALTGAQVLTMLQRNDLAEVVEALPFGRAD